MPTDEEVRVTNGIIGSRIRTAAGMATAIVAAGVLTTASLAGSAAAASADVVISQVYGGGGNSGATYTNDYIQLRNTSAAAVDVSGWSVQYASAAGSTWQVTQLTGSIAPGADYLIAEAAGTGGSTPLPTPAVTGTIAMSATSGKVALVTTQTALACGSACHADAAVRDYVGFGTANDAETAPAPTLSNTTAALRVGGGTTDTDNNSTDFTAGEPDPAGGGSEPPTGDPARIHEIQGAAHRSPLEGKNVIEVPGVVTAVSGNGFWFQDPDPDADPATSEGLFVFTSSHPTVAIGDSVQVAGRISEFRPGNNATNLTTTELGQPTVTVLGHGAAVPAPVQLGPGGVTAPKPPRADAPGDVEAATLFDRSANALDFYESMEGMLLRIKDSVAVGPSNDFGELAVLPGGAGSPRTERGGIRYTYADPNSEKIILDDVLAPLPTANVGDKLPGTTDGVLDYNFGNYMLEVLTTPQLTSGGITRETTRAQRSTELAVATYNVENLAPSDPQSKFDRLAGGIVTNLAKPDIVAVEEVQDNSGATDDGVVAADQTWTKLIDAIIAAGGPRYDYRSINPVNDEDGGQPGGNIRVGFLFRTDRGITFVDRPGGDSTTATGVVRQGGHAALTLSPGRVDPASDAWDSSRKPLAGEFRFRGRTVFVIANHFASKGGDQPLFGRFQPPTRSSEVQRHKQAQEMRDFISQIQRADPLAAVVMLGDLNDFEFSETADIVVGHHTMVDLPRTLPANKRYSYVFEGNSQVLDQVLISLPLALLGFDYDVVHINSEFADQASDHDPQVVRLPYFLGH